MTLPKKIKLSNIKTNFSCSLCNTILKDPVQLPCGISVCLEHIRNLRENFLKCHSCNQDHVVPQKGFDTNVDLKKKIESDAHLSEAEKHCKNSIQEMFQKLFDLLEDTVLKFNEFECFNHDHFTELETQIELQRENLKIKIDELSQEVINSVKEKRKHFARESTKVVNVEELKGMIERKKENSLENFRQLELSTATIEAMQVDLNENLKDIQRKFDIFENLKMLVQSIAFDSTNHFNGNDFGRIYGEEDYLVKANENGCEIWNIETNKRVKKFIFLTNGNEDNDSENSLIYAIDYKVVQKSNLLVLGSDSILRIYDLKTDSLPDSISHFATPCKLIKSFGIKDTIKCFAINKTTVVASEREALTNKNINLYFYNIESGKLDKMIKLKKFNFVDIIGLLENGNVLCALNGRVRLIDYNTGNVIRKYSAKDDDRHSSVLLANEVFASSSEDEIRIWNIETGHCIGEIQGDFEYAQDFLLTNDGRLICCLTYYDELEKTGSVIKIWDSLKNYEYVKTIKSDRCICKLKLLGQDKLVGLDDEAVIKIWNIDTGVCINTLDKFDDILERGKIDKTFTFCPKF
jgi:WD40 repeat protein